MLVDAFPSESTSSSGRRQSPTLLAITVSTCASASLVRPSSPSREPQANSILRQLSKPSSPQLVTSLSTNIKVKSLTPDLPLDFWRIASHVPPDRPPSEGRSIDRRAAARTCTACACSVWHADTCSCKSPPKPVTCWVEQTVQVSDFNLFESIRWIDLFPDGKFGLLYVSHSMFYMYWCSIVDCWAQRLNSASKAVMISLSDGRTVKDLFRNQGRFFEVRKGRIIGDHSNSAFTLSLSVFWLTDFFARNF